MSFPALEPGEPFPDLDLPDHTGRGTTHEPYRPMAFTLRPDLRIHSAYNGYWYWGRPSLEELRQDMRAITREIREDWELPRA